MNDRNAPWVIVLAAGSGTRLSSMTVGTDGVAVPKQFCSLRGGRSLLVDAVGRARQLTTRERVLAVVAPEHERWWGPQLRCLPTENVLVQPRNRGTGPGLLLPLAHVLERDPLARFCVLPSDHHVDRPAVLQQAMLRALRELERGDDGLWLFGVVPDSPDTEYGWIVPGARRGGASSVAAFVEKPALPRAAELMAMGAVWNSFLLAGRARTTWSLCEQLLPEATAALAAAHVLPAPARPSALQLAYETMAARDFSRVVLEQAGVQLRLAVVPECGWTDLGTPRRVAECVARLDQRARGLPPRAPWFPTIDLAQVLRAVGPVLASA